jgi:hypothetical protein
MAVGLPLKTTYANGDVYSASDVNDTNGTVNLFTSSTLSRAAGKNGLINGGMDFWARGTSFTNVANTIAYSADRWDFLSGAVNGTFTMSRVASGLTGFSWAMRVQRTAGSTSTAFLNLAQALETSMSLPFAGQNVTISFYAKAGANYSATSNALTSIIIGGTGTDQNNFTGGAGFTGQTNILISTATLTTSWQRFSFTTAISSSYTQLAAYFGFAPTGTAGANDFYDITGIQLEIGSVATTFTRAGGTIQGELAACQRYYWRITGANAYEYFGLGYSNNPASAVIQVNCPVILRTNPTVLDFSTLAVADGITVTAVNTLTLANSTTSGTKVVPLLASLIGTPLTTYRPYSLIGNNSTSAFLGLGAEL